MYSRTFQDSPLRSLSNGRPLSLQKRPLDLNYSFWQVHPSFTSQLEASSHRAFGFGNTRRVEVGPAGKMLISSSKVLSSAPRQCLGLCSQGPLEQLPPWTGIQSLLKPMPDETSVFSYAFSSSLIPFFSPLKNSFSNLSTQSFHFLLGPSHPFLGPPVAGLTSAEDTTRAHPNTLDWVQGAQGSHVTCEGG